MVVLQGWFNDQYRCFGIFVEALSDRQRQCLFADEETLDSVKKTYRDMWLDGRFEAAAIRERGVHRKSDHLTPWSKNLQGFFYWVTCVFREAEGVGLEEIVDDLRTVEEAHRRFKPWFYRRRELVRGLNAADAARILARYGYLEPETRPLLARGALRGAAILLDGQPRSKDTDQLELDYGEEAARVALERKAADHIANSKEFSGRFQMEEGESWFCARSKTLRPQSTTNVCSVSLGRGRLNSFWRSHSEARATDRERHLLPAPSPPSLLCEEREAVGRGGEPGVPAATTAPRGHQRHKAPCRQSDRQG